MRVVNNTSKRLFRSHNNIVHALTCNSIISALLFRSYVSFMRFMRHSLRSFLINALIHVFSSLYSLIKYTVSTNRE